MLKISSNKIAIVLFNLGGPDSLKTVESFLFNIFYDKRILNLPNPFRWLLAKFISKLRKKLSANIYSKVGGKSTLISETKAQKQALEFNLKNTIGKNFRIFICMRYWNPNINDVVNELIKYKPSEVILLPLYPQFSSITTGSSVENFTKFFPNKDLSIKTICCYATNKEYIDAFSKLVRDTLQKLIHQDSFRVLFSAHSIPIKSINKGDPYQWQVTQTVSKIIETLNIKNLDYKITYQSRVGPIKWLKPNTIDEIKLTAKEKKAVVIVPISFVSEHVETLFELDYKYFNIACKYSLEYLRVPTLRVNEMFINALKNIIIDMINNKYLPRLCPNNFSLCFKELQ